MARPKKPTDELKDQRVPIMMSEDELKAIDDWRFANRLPSRGEAIRRLCQIGILAEDTLDHIADRAVETMNFVTDEIGAARREFRTLVNDETADVLFTQEELSDAVSAGVDRHYEVLDRVADLSQLVISLYNAILPFAEAETVKRGAQASEAVIDQANKIFEYEASRRREREENRYISINLVSQPVEERERYEALNDEDKERFLAAAIEQLRAEDEADPEAFHEKYGHKPFWEKEGWLERAKLRKLSE